MTMANSAKAPMATAIFAGGCFWCMEPPFAKLPGVEAVISGYTGGSKVNPTYQEVCDGTTGQTEAIQVIYNPQLVHYNTLLDTFWANIDPTDGGGQFVDRGQQYRSAIFYLDDEQRRLAESSRAKLAASGVFKGAIVTEISAAGPFFPAEDYHQNYYKTNPQHYNYYRWGSGRDAFLESTWKKEKK
jgi:methionine-S-sulfoxide reductase